MESGVSHWVQQYTNEEIPTTTDSVGFEYTQEGRHSAVEQTEGRKVEEANSRRRSTSTDGASNAAKATLNDRRLSAGCDV